jgi:hypothetical protein
VNIYIRVLSAVFIIFIGCKQKQITPYEYVRWVENTENGLRIEKEMNGFKFRLQHKPSSYIALREVGFENADQIMQYYKRKEELDSFYYFNLDIASIDDKGSVLSHNLNTQEEYYARINYFTSFAQSDLKLVCGKDTLPCTLYHFERTYDLSPYNTIVIGFKMLSGKKIYHDDLLLIFDDKILSVGQMRFLIKSNILKNIPKIVL